MSTAILVLILMVIAVAIFYAGIIVGAMFTSKIFSEATSKALEESNLTYIEQEEILRKAMDYAKRKD